MNTRTIHMLSTPVLALLIAGAATFAAAQEGPAASQADVAAQASALELTDGEVRKIDRDAGKITLRHGEIKNLGMAPMTMVLRVRDAAMLDGLGAGDKVRFGAERIEGAITVVRMEKTR